MGYNKKTGARKERLPEAAADVQGRIERLTGGRRMAKKKVYAVRTGRETGIFDTWDECQKMVTGYPGAEFKGFLTRDEAEAFLNREKSTADVDNPNPAEEGLIIYVDGSFDAEAGKYSYGCIVLTPDGEIIELSESGDDPQYSDIRNVAGEMLGAQRAAEWAVEHEYPTLDIRYDYVGIEKWVSGDWKANHALTQKYAEIMKEYQKKIKIKFTKVEAHTGVYFNEKVDQLAKKALREG